jgi:hypothetical protein
MGMSAALDGFRPVKVPVGDARIDHAIVSDLKAIEGARRRYAQALAKLVGQAVKPSYLLDRIMVTAIIEWAAGNARNMKFYFRACHGLASTSYIREQIHYLADRKLLLVRSHPDDRRFVEIVPTQKLVDFFAALADHGPQRPDLRVINGGADR